MATNDSTTRTGTAASGPGLSLVLGVILAALLTVLLIHLILSASADPLLVQAGSAAVFILFPLVAIRKTGIALHLARPNRITATTSALVGILASVAGAWLVTVTSNLLSQWIGLLSPTATTAGSDLTILLVLGVIMPLGQSVLFWLFLQNGVSRLGGTQSAWLTAFLFAGAAVITSSTGISGGVSMMPLSVGAALLVYYSGTAWPGVIASVAHGLAGLLLPPFLLDLLGLNALSLNWIGATLLSGFGIFFLLHAARALLPPPATRAADRHAALIRREPILWVYGVVIVVVAVLELFLRSRS